MMKKIINKKNNQPRLFFLCANCYIITQKKGNNIAVDPNM